MRTEGSRLVASGIGLILTVEASFTRPLSPDGLVRVLTNVAGLGAEAGDDSPVVVVLAGFDRKSIDVAVAQVRHGRYLLIDQPGRGRWCGGSPSDCDPETVNTVLRMLQDQVTDRLHRVLAEAGPGVHNGLFRGPTLKLTNKWIDVDTVLREAVGTTTAAFLIAGQMMAHGTKLAPETQVLRVATATMEWVDAVARCAGVKANADVIIDEFDSSSEELERLKDDTPIVVCTDLILTENNAKRALAEVLNWRAVPILVLTAFDARGHGGDITVLDSSVPVVSLAQVAVSTSISHGATPVDVDPVLRSVVPRRRVERRYPWDPGEFLTACSAVERSLSLGHTGRAAHRHFTVNFDVGRLIADGSPLRTQIVDRLVAEVVAWSAQMTSLVICHPDHAEEYAGRLARLVSTELRRALPGVTVSTVPVRRAVLGSRWAFPEGLDDIPPESDVVVLDWGSIEAVTITQLIRLAAEAGAGRVFGLVLLCQLQEHDERALTMIQAVQGTRLSGEGPTIVSVPTRVQFVTAVGLSAMPLNKCPLCALARQWEADTHRGLPRVIERHLEKLGDTLRVRSRAEVANSPFDAFGARTENVAAYIRLRIRLLAAMRDTAIRQLVADEFIDLAAHGTRTARHAAINILAAERQWLKLPPLRFANCRKAVAKLALAVALEKETRRRLRLQAVIVLVAAAPEVLVRELPKLWESFSGNSLLTLHLLYQLHRIAERRRGDTPVEPSEFRDQIALCREALKKTPFRIPGVREELAWQLTKLNYRMNIRLMGETQGDARNAWRALRDQYLHRLTDHIDAESAILQLRLHMDNVRYQGGLDAAGWTTVRRNWSTVVTFLADYLLPFLPSLAEPLNGAFAEEHFDTTEREILTELSSAEWVRYVNRLEGQFRVLQEAGDQPEQARNRDELARSLQLLHETILEAGGTELELARFAHFLNACPTELGSSLTACIQKSENARNPVHITLGPGDIPEIEVFCHEELLENTINQLIRNTVTRKHRAPGQENEVVGLEISVTVDDKIVRVFFRNTGTVPTEVPGRGIATARRKLADFGGSLVEAAPTGEWSFEIELRLRRWSDETWEGSAGA
ncbi:hypothetical protein ACWED2_05540 [Amycolatopsis sp. NPDC005003]